MFSILDMMEKYKHNFNEEVKFYWVLQAFSTLQHSPSLCKSNAHGFDKRSLKLIKSNRMNRKQRCKVLMFLFDEAKTFWVFSRFKCCYFALAKKIVLCTYANTTTQYWYGKSLHRAINDLTNDFISWKIAFWEFVIDELERNAEFKIEFPSNNYLNRNTGKRCKICSRVTKKISLKSFWSL